LQKEVAEKDDVDAHSHRATPMNKARTNISMHEERQGQKIHDPRQCRP
jgi:hypothetical protein